MSTLESINVGADVKKLNIKELELLSEDIRKEILSVTEKNGGHLASNLGVVETTVALYKIFDFAKDKLIFDVGHQCYAHKILSDRKDRFSTIRTDGGISGFPLRSESCYDAFIGGHAGTSIAAGIGFCEARDKLKEDYTVICMVGDASIVNGLNLEALSVKGEKPKNFIVVLNDNGMSISKNQNGLYRYLSKTTTKRSYVVGKKTIRKVFRDSFITKLLGRFKNFVKRLIGNSNYFEQQGFKYVGVVDGNNVTKLVKALSRVQLAAKEKAILLHIKTTKGKGYSKAEEQADVYHGVGEKLVSEQGDFSICLGQSLCEMIDDDDKIVAITAGMKDGTGLNAVEKAHPKNFVDVGIAEEYAVTSAAGMAAGGLKPFVAIYSTFLQRAYDQVMHDVCIQNLPVVFCLDRSGLVGKDGCTHQGVFDLSYLLHLPNLTVLAPNTKAELKDALVYAKELSRPVAIRYPKNSGVERRLTPLSKDPWEVVADGDGEVILAVGPRMLDLALKVREKKQNLKVVSVRMLKPLCSRVLQEIKDKKIITLEENSVIGGFGSYVSSYYAEKDQAVNVISFGVKDEFVAHGNVNNQLEENGFTVENILANL
ncbi:MAG: 1-deoxy-D-xylulose-5-phosphate synthase [Clostridia bacterium]|nr:1-deoxy-D-xylulose-5-phosphate synthase [Clostridia bacterium]